LYIINRLFIIKFYIIYKYKLYIIKNTIGKDRLHRILRAYSNLDLEVGYT